MQKYLSDPLHWPLVVHLKNATLCCAGHSQLVPRVQTDLLFTPAATIIQSSCIFSVHHNHPVRKNALQIYQTAKKEKLHEGIKNIYQQWLCKSAKVIPLHYLFIRNGIKYSSGLLSNGLFANE